MKLRPLLLVASSLLAAAAAAQQAPPPLGEPRDFTLQTRETVRLDNGLAITFIDFGRVPRVTILAALRTGNIDEGSDTWLADLTVEMLKEGTATRSAADIARQSAEMGGSLFAGAGAEQVTVGMMVLSEHAASAATLVADVLRNPLLPEAELPRLIDNFQRSLAVAMSSPDALADQALAELVYGDHPLGRAYPTAGQLAAYTIEDLRQFHAQNFGARRTHVYVAGRYDRATLEAALRSAFGSWEPGPAPRDDPPQARPGLVVQLIDRPGAPQSSIRMALPAPDPAHPDYMAFTLANTLLGGAFSSRITTNIREDKGYSYSPNSSILARRRAALWVQEADVTTAVTASALREILGEVRRLAAEPPDQAELAAMQSYRAGLFVVQNSSPNGVLGQLAFMDLHGLPDEFLSRWVANIHAVTPDEVSERVRRWLDPAQMKLVVVGELAEIEAALRALPELQGASWHGNGAYIVP
jgi:zinc protease